MTSRVITREGIVSRQVPIRHSFFHLMGALCALLLGADPLIAAPGAAASPYGGPTIRVKDFVSSEGVTTHISYTDGRYANVEEIIYDLKYLGIERVRDAVIAPGTAGQPSIQAWWRVAYNGIKFNMGIGGGAYGRSTGSWTSPSLEDRLDNIRWMQRTVPGSVVSIEGPNEINNEPVVYETLGTSKKGADELDAGLHLQRDLVRLVRADPTLKNVPVYYFTGYGAGTIPAGPDPAEDPSLGDFNNQHPYPRNGEPPAAWLQRSQTLGNSSKHGPHHGGPAVYTETGYSSNVGTWHGVPEDVQAKYTLDLLLDAAEQNISAVYLYELMDAYAPGSRQGNAGFGLFDYTGRPKKVAQALRAMNTILRKLDPGTERFSVQPLAMSYSAEDNRTKLQQMQASPNRYVIAVWNERPLLAKPGDLQAKILPPVNVEMVIPRSAKISLYDPFVGSEARPLGNGRTVKVAITDHPVFIALDLED